MPIEKRRQSHQGMRCHSPDLLVLIGAGASVRHRYRVRFRRGSREFK